MLYLPVSHIWTRADPFEDITLFFSFLQIHFHHLNNALFMLIYPPFYLHALLSVTLSVLIFFYLQKKYTLHT